MCIMLAAIMFTGCGAFERSVAKWTGFSKMCVDNVEYIQFTSGASVAYTVEGKIKTCK